MSRYKVRIQVFICIFLMVIFHVGVAYLKRVMHTNVFNFVDNTSLCGVLSMLQILVGVATVGIDWKKGAKGAIIVIAITFVFTLQSVVIIKDYSAIPGLVIAIVGGICIATLRKQYGSRDREANLDQLTNIANRRRLMREFSNRINQNQPFYFVYMDLNGFKRVNDEFGHMTGDMVLQSTASYWSSKKKKDDFLARLGGDEFCMLIPEKNVDDIVEYISPFISEISNLSVEGVDGNLYNLIGANAGVVQFPKDGDTITDLLRKADFAMLNAKKDPSINYCLFDKEIEDQILATTKTEELVKKGLETNSFYMVYQPQFEVTTKKLRGFEALIRLRDEKGNIVSPGTFIPIMERTGTILKIDYYVLKNTMNQFLPIVEKNPEVTVSVNISARHISEESFADSVAEILKETGFPAKNLEIEITEYSFVHSTDDAIYTLNRLKEMGIMIALDDFGTGYSSLSMLSKLPLDLIKIDKSMIDNIHKNEDARKLVDQIVSIGHTYHCQVLSEGIELQEQADILKENGCNFIQGYLWGKPMSYDEAVKISI